MKKVLTASIFCAFVLSLAACSSHDEGKKGCRRCTAHVDQEMVDNLSE